MSKLSKEIKLKIRKFTSLSLQADKVRKEIDEYFKSEYGLDLANDGNNSDDPNEIIAGSINDVLIDTALDGNFGESYKLIEEALQDIISEEDKP